MSEAETKDEQDLEDFCNEVERQGQASRSPALLCVGGRYNWINQPERLVYLGNNWSSNGYWHQFAKVESPETVWCEVLDSDLKMIEETKVT